MNNRILITMGILSLLASTAGAATITADFIHGNDDTTYVDAYHGIAGDGWATPWSETTNSSNVVPTTGVITPADTGYNEVFAGGGSYLHATTAYLSAGDRRYGVVREHDLLDAAKPRVIEFYFRLDDDLSTFGEVGGGSSPHYDRYQIFDSPSSANVASSSSSWQIMGYSVATGNTPAGTEMEWSFVNGLGNGTLSTSMAVNTDVPLVGGATYYFRIDADYTNLKYDAYVSTTIGSTTYEYDSTTDTNPDIADGMGFRRDSTAPTNTYLCFTGRANETNDSRAFSVDGITISEVPEPGAIVLLITGLGLMAIRRRRR